MTGYYDEVLDEIRALLAEGKAEEALYLIRKEEEMPYLPADFEQQLKRLKKEAVFLKADQKEERIRPLSQILGMLKGSSESQLAAASQISDYNLRECTEELREYLQKDPQPEASALIIDALAAQEINEEFTLLRDGLEYIFWAEAVTLVMLSDVSLEALTILEECAGRNPAIHEMARSVLVHEAYLALPVSYIKEEAEYLAMDALKEVSSLMDEGRTYREAARARNYAEPDKIS